MRRMLNLVRPPPGIFRMAGLGVLVVVALAWTLSRWWYLKLTHDTPATGRIVVWLYSGKLTLFTIERSATPPTRSGVRGPAPLATPPTESSIEFLPVSKLRAAPAWHWG